MEKRLMMMNVIWIGLCLLVMGASVVTLALAEPISESRPTPLPSSNVYVFVSLSMPAESLRQWAAQAQKIQAPLILRGLAADSWTATQRAVSPLVQAGYGGVVIDPRLFQRYHITTVPAVVVRRPVVTAPCLPHQSCGSPEIYDVVSGDVGLEKALQAIIDRGDTAVDIARQALAAMRP